LYHLDNRLVAVGLIVGLDYASPYLNPYQEFQRLKTHPAIRPLLESGRRIAYGARALNEGGLQSVPQLVFPGAALIGCSAGFVNVARIKGSHTAMMSGMLAADAIADGDLARYPERLRQSWVYEELHRARNLRPAFHRWGLWKGLAYAALDQYGFGGRAPWTLHTATPDHAMMKHAAVCTPIDYPPPDGTVTFDLMSSVYLSNTHHEEDQPPHLQLKDPTLPVEVNLPFYDAPEERYCPAGVYELVQHQGMPKLAIHAANCVHCKTCDIKDPKQNIVWVTPEGGGGPNYAEM
ncbi:MAG: electron transfer flavoprotein-ubiquinone oxidoreductase, partial [Alphaproteobacteria bacterium]|nr:electron transfer flavoprotein-ubiquinone oxidoreductase [Alphaproteobacteria bacterium]